MFTFLGELPNSTNFARFKNIDVVLGGFLGVPLSDFVSEVHFT